MTTLRDILRDLIIEAALKSDENGVISQLVEYELLDEYITHIKERLIG